jgi:hypothetical protein
MIERQKITYRRFTDILRVHSFRVHDGDGWDDDPEPRWDIFYYPLDLLSDESRANFKREMRNICRKITRLEKKLRRNG